MSFIYKFMFNTTLLVVFSQVILFSQGTKFVHTADTSNIVSNWTNVDHPDLNGDADAVMFFTENWNPGGIGGIYNNASTGVWYTGANWAIFNQDVTNIPDGASFNVFVPSGSSHFVHDSDSANVTSNWTNIDHPSLNGNPDAMFIITPNWNSGGTGGIYNDAATGVWYTGANWAIYNQDISSMPIGASFNVLVFSASEGFVHTVDSANVALNWTNIDHPALNGNPDAVFFITANWNPGGIGGIYNDAPTGVWYTGTNWAIFNQDISSMPIGASFNVFLAEGTTAVDDNNIVVEGFQLEQNYPNPFNPATSIKYNITENGFVSLKIYDMLGEEVAVLVNETLPAGSYEVEFNASSLTSGVYFYSLKSGSFTSTKKMILLK